MAKAGRDRDGGIVEFPAVAGEYQYELNRYGTKRNKEH
jgi:hypothetical protein